MGAVASVLTGLETAYLSRNEKMVQIWCIHLMDYCNILKAMMFTKLYHIYGTKQDTNELESLLAILFKIILGLERIWKGQPQRHNTSLNALHRERGKIKEFCVKEPWQERTLY